jgi:hypothetical protein
MGEALTSERNRAVAIVYILSEGVERQFAEGPRFVEQSDRRCRTTVDLK